MINDTTLAGESTPKQILIPAWIVLITVFITGASVLIIELMGTRLLAPFYGSGIYTWSALISVTLAALAAGYFSGGRLADRVPHYTSLYTLCLGAGILTSLTPLFGAALLPTLINMDDMRISVLLSSCLLFFPNLFLLGAIGPFVIRLLIRAQNQAGSISGLVFAVSTIGSLLGALGTGFILVPNFGVKTIFTFCGLLLLALAMFGYLRLGLFKRSVITIIIMLASLYNILSEKPEPTSSIELLEQTPGFYGQIQVIRTSGIKTLLVDGVGQNYVMDNGIYTTPYINFIAALPYLQNHVDHTLQKGLVIGLGAGQLPVMLQQTGMDIETVEIDPLIADMARKHFDFNIDAEKIHFMDGRVFLSKSQNQYDYIIIDAFSADQIAWHLLSRQALEVAKARLTKNGLIVINLTSLQNNTDIATVQKTLSTVLPHVRTFQHGVESTLNSIVFLASTKPVNLSVQPGLLKPSQTTNVKRFLDNELHNLSSSIVLSDDFNPVGFQRTQVQLQWRREMREFLGEEQLSWLIF